MSISSYPKVFNMGHRAVLDIFKEDVVVQEKVDGSQFSFGVMDGELTCRSKGKVQNVDAPDKLFEKATETIRNLKDKLHPEWIYSGEYLRTPGHNTLKYNRVPKQHIILFDIRVGDEVYLSYNEVKKEADRLDLEVVPLVFTGKVNNLDHLKDILETESVLGGVKMEGVVAKNYVRFSQDGKALMAKIVRPEFKEQNNKLFRKSNPLAGDILETIKERYKTEARWNKAIQHLRDNGELENSPRDIGKLIQEVRRDVKEECEEEIKEILFKWAWKKVSNSLTGGFPEYYKELLLKKMEF